MRIGLVFPFDPQARAPGIDVLRLEALAQGFKLRGARVDILAPVAAESLWRGSLRIRPLARMGQTPGYDLLKTCYHRAIHLVQDFEGPVVARLVRVVDERHPARDRRQRGHLLAAQDEVSRLAAAVAFNNPENQARWRRLFGSGLPSLLTPTGCPERLPPRRCRPFPLDRVVAIYLGSLASSRQVEMLNRCARALAGLAEVHLVGRNKSGLYGRTRRLDTLVRQHGEKDPREIWDFLRAAHLGLALAVGPEAFDNDSSKVVHYLRAGLPVLAEEPILQIGLLRSLGMGQGFGYGRVGELRQAARALLSWLPAPATRRWAMSVMRREHSWLRRVDAYLELFQHLLASPGQGRP